MRSNPRFWAITILLIIALLIVLVKCCGEGIPSRGLTITPDDTTMRVTKNNDGSITTNLGVMEAMKADYINQLNAKDSTNAFLIREVNRYKKKLANGGSVVAFGTETTFTGSSTSTITGQQIFIKGDSILVYPKYEAKSKDTTWINWSVKATKDSTKVLFKSKDKYSVLIGTEHVGLFKHRTVAEVTTFNPYNSVKTMRAFEVKEDRSKFQISAQVGYGITLHGFSPYIGIGIGYTLIRF